MTINSNSTVGAALQELEQDQESSQSASQANADVQNAPWSLNNFPIISNRFKLHRSQISDREHRITDEGKTTLKTIKQLGDFGGASLIEWKNTLRFFSLTSERVAFKARVNSTFTSLTQNYTYWSSKSVDHFHPFASSYRYTFRPHFELSCECTEDLAGHSLHGLPVSARRGAIFSLWFLAAGLVDASRWLKSLGLF